VRAWRPVGRSAAFVLRRQRGNMDSPANHYRANKKVATTMPIRPAAGSGCDRNRAKLVYCQRAREAFPGVPVSPAGSRRRGRLAHYGTTGATRSKRYIVLA